MVIYENCIVVTFRVKLEQSTEEVLVTTDNVLYVKDSPHVYVAEGQRVCVVGFAYTGKDMDDQLVLLFQIKFF